MNQLEMSLPPSADRPVAQLQADASHHATAVVVYTFEVRINGALKHSIVDTVYERGSAKANWIAKQAAIKGWPAAVKCVRS